MPYSTMTPSVNEDAAEASKLVKRANFRNCDAKQMQESTRQLSRICNLRRNEFSSMFNTNNLDAGLQRQVILQELVRAFGTRVTPLKAFAHTFSSLALEGTDKIDVPYFPLSGTASTDWNAANGYVATDTTQNTREITVNKRKYQAMSLTSNELRRQPFQNWQQLAIMNAEKLAVDVVTDIMSVITLANYGASLKSAAPASFSGDDVADLYGSATDLNWPDTGRSLVLTTGYKVALLKDPTFKQYLAFGDTDPTHKAAIKEAYGFENIFTIPTAAFPTNAQFLVGFICHLSAVLVGFAPIKPAPAVAVLLADYQVAEDEVSGAVIEYRVFGDAQKDKQLETVESNYGYIKGKAESLARLTSQ